MGAFGVPAPDSFLDALMAEGFLGEEDAGLPLDGLDADSTPNDLVAWSMLMEVDFGAQLAFADPAFTRGLYERWCRLRASFMGPS